MHVSMDGLFDHVAAVLFVASITAMTITLTSSIKMHSYDFNTLQDKTDSRHYIAYNDETATYFPFTREQILLTPLINDPKDEFNVYCNNIKLEDNTEMDMVITVKSIYNSDSEESEPLKLYDRIPPISMFEKTSSSNVPIPRTEYGVDLVYNPEINKSPHILFYNQRKE